MKHLIALFVSGILFVAGIYALYKPLGRELIPRLAPFFIGETGIWGTIKESTEKESDSLNVTGLSGDINIVRDSYGTPHVYAESYEDAIFAMGYIVAKDRIFQMEWMNRMVSGGMSEWFGNHYLETDKFMLSLGLDRVASTIMQQASKTNEYELWRIFSNGVNANINEQYNRTASFEYSLLGLPNRYNRPADGVRILLLYHFLTNWNMDDFYIQQIVDAVGEEMFKSLFFKHIDYTLSADGKSQQIDTRNRLISKQERPYKNAFEWFQKQLNLLEARVGLVPGIFTGNVLTTKLTEGDPVLTSVLNGPLTQPSLFYEIYFHLPEMNIHGFTLPGIPALLFGNNDYVSWTYNSAPVNVIDFNLVKEDEVDIKESFAKIQVRERGEITFPMRYTINGPLFYAANELIEMNWSSLNGKTFAVPLKDAFFSRSVTELHENLSKANLPVSTVIAIDQNQSGIFFSGKIPSRDHYLGIQLRKDVQQTSANYPNAPVWFKKGETLILTNQFPFQQIPDNFPYFSKEGFWRNNRLSKLVSQLGTPKSVADLEKLFQDFKMQEEELKPLFTDLFKGKLSSPLNSLGNDLREWDYEANKDAGFPKYFSNLEKIVKTATFDEFPVRFFPDNESIYRMMRKDPHNKIFDNQQTSEHESATDILYKTLNSALELSVLESGSPENWTWANSNRATIKHISNNTVMNQLSTLTLVREGFSNTVLKTLDGVFPIAHLVRYSALIGKNQVKSRSLLFSGVSANRYSPFYENQLNLWASGDLKPSFEWTPADSLKKNGYVYIRVN